MAIDSTLEDLPNTPDTVAVFGRYLSARGPSAFAQARADLAECGTHAIVDAGFWPGRTSECIGGCRVLRSVTPEMLVMWDRGLHDYAACHERRLVVGRRQGRRTATPGG